MADLSRIFALLKIIVFGINIVLALFYSLSMLCIRRLRKRINILTLNICFGTICISVYFMLYFIMYEYHIEYLFTETTCTFLFYAQSTCLCGCSFAFVTLTINRFFTILCHTQRFFRTKKFMGMCIVSQWIVGSLVSLPFALYVTSVND